MNKLSWRPIKPLKVRFGKIIVSFDNKANNNQPYPITIHHHKHVLRFNAPIIILLIESFELKA